MNDVTQFLPKCGDQIFSTVPTRFEYRGHIFDAQVDAYVHELGADIVPVFFRLLNGEWVELPLSDFVHDAQQRKDFYLEFLEYFWGGIALSESWLKVMHGLFDTCIDSKCSSAAD